MFQMNTDKYKELTAPCFRDEDPPCSSACPLGMDIRKFISKMKGGKYKAAYRAFRAKAVFCGIVSELCPAPCSSACTRAKKGKDPVRIRELEAACFEKGIQKPERYRLAKKEQKIAVVGGGLSGLSCAYRLASRGYHITVYEKAETVGGLTLSLMDADKALTDIRREFLELSVCSFITGHEVTSEEMQELISTFDAVYIATGMDGPDFGRTVKEYCKSDLPGVFMGGLLTGEKNQIEAMADGFNAAEFIELYFKLGYDASPTFELLGAKEPDDRFYALDYKEADKETDKENADKAEPDEASFDPVAESSKCYECNCDKCFQVCPLMQQVQKYPKKMAVDTITTLRPHMIRRPGVRMIMGCTFCGKCKEVCPMDIDMSLFYKWARRDYYDDETMPESFHEFWLKDMEFSLSDEASTVYTPNPQKPSDYVFFPGCQVTGMFPDMVEKVYSFIRESSDNASVYLGCCGVPAEWAGMESTRKAVSARIRDVWQKLGQPVFLLACTTCRKNLAEYCPEIETETIYRYMAEHEDALPKIDGTDQETNFRIFDPCGVAGDEETINAVRKLLLKAEIHAKELDGLPGCCGFGGHIFPSNPTLQEAISAEGAPDEGTVISYCANCVDTFCKNGHSGFHLLELFFGQEERGRNRNPEETGTDGCWDNAPAPWQQRELPTLGQRRNHRRMLKQKFSLEEIMPYEYMHVMEFTDNALDKMQKNLITEEDVDEVLKEKPAFSDADTGLMYARRRLGNITLWVVFREDDGRYRITDLYKYRMEVQE